MNSSTDQIQEPIHWGHFRAIFLVAILLLGFAWLKNPQLFSSLSFHKKQSTADAQNVPHYYPYVADAADQQPQVLGASTQPQGPMIINEDGSVTPAGDSGSVLGASTDPAMLQELNNIPVISEIADSNQSIQKYLSDSSAIEVNYVNDTDFVQALSSNNPATVAAQIPKIQNIITELESLKVPHSAVTLQKNKILQYQSAIVMLQNFNNPAGDTATMNQAFQDFIQSQDTINSETGNLTAALAPDNASN